MTIGGIYEILNTANGKRYIGQASDFPRRWKRHRADLKSGVHHSRALQRAWDKYGATAFDFNIAMLCPQVDLSVWEQRYITELAPEYNVARNVEHTTLGVKFSTEVRAKMSLVLQGNSRRLGTSQSAEARAKLSRFWTGVKRPDVAAALRGLVRSPEFGAAVTARQLGRLLTLETRKKIGDAQRGKKRGPHSVGTCEKISAALRGRPSHPQSLGARAKISAAMVARRARERAERAI